MKQTTNEFDRFYFNREEAIMFDEYYFLNFENDYVLCYSLFLKDPKCTSLGLMKGKETVFVLESGENDIFKIMVYLYKLEDLSDKSKQIIIDYCNNYIKNKGIFYTQRKLLDFT